MANREYHRSPIIVQGLVALLLSLGIAAALYLWPSWSPLASWLVSINLVTFFFYGFDKMRAKGEGSRVPEKILYALVFVGGTVGGLAAMLLFHHKIRKRSFMRVFWIIVALQIVGICVWLLILR
jgi:uncharacterized membrane protein YsdA (DUF1294 family)